MYKLTLRNSAYLRTFHWLLVLLLLIIVPTGFYIHQPFSFLYLHFRIMFVIHIFSGFSLSYLLMTRAYYALFHQNWRSVVFTWQDLRELPSLLKYYLFFRQEKPPERKYNTGQRLMYTLWFIFLSLANISGALAYKKTHFLGIARLVGGVHHLDWATLSAALFLAYTIPLHIYLAVTEHMGNLQSVVTGYTYVLKPGDGHPVGSEPGYSTRLPGKWLRNKLKALLH